MKKVGVAAILVAVVLLAAGVIAEAQQAKGIPRIGYLAGVGGNVKNPGRYTEIFLQALRDRGYTEGKNILIEYRFADGKGAAYEAQLADELVRLKPDVVVLGPLPAILAAKKSTKTIPIVMITSNDPVQRGLIDSLARPGGNLTGVTRMTRELSGKRLELLKEMVPTISRIGIMLAADATALDNDFKRYEAEARALKLQVQRLEVSPSNPDFEALFDAATKTRVNALISMSYGLLNRHSKLIAELGLKKRVPVMFERSESVEHGGLASYTADDTESYKRAAVYVDKILKGSKPADLPVEQAMKFEFVINLKTAKQIGLEIPQWTLMKADRVIR